MGSIIAKWHHSVMGKDGTIYGLPYGGAAVLKIEPTFDFDIPGTSDGPMVMLATACTAGTLAVVTSCIYYWKCQQCRERARTSEHFNSVGPAPCSMRISFEMRMPHMVGRHDCTSIALKVAPP